MAAAAAPQPKGAHETVGSILATGGIITALVVAAVVFAIATVLARRRNARPAAPLYAPGGTASPLARASRAVVADGHRHRNRPGHWSAAPSSGPA